MHELPVTGQSEAVEQGGRHCPSAHVRPFEQSLLREQVSLLDAAVLLQAGMASATVHASPIRRTRAALPSLALGRACPNVPSPDRPNCAIRLIVCLPE